MRLKRGFTKLQGAVPRPEHHRPIALGFTEDMSLNPFDEHVIGQHLEVVCTMPHHALEFSTDLQDSLVTLMTKEACSDGVIVAIRDLGFRDELISEKLVVPTCLVGFVFVQKAISSTREYRVVCFRVVFCLGECIGVLALQSK